jgi:hypothetical protein
MENIFILAFIISVIYFLCKFIEMKYIVKDIKPLKVLFRDSLHVYISVVLGLFIIKQFKELESKSNFKGGNINVFVDNPDF